MANFMPASHAAFAGWRHIMLRLMVLGFMGLACQHSTSAEGAFIPANGRTDMVYDSGRNILYISAGTSVLRYQLSTNSFLAPYQLSGSLAGLDISPDGNTLVVADHAYTDANVWVWVINLQTGTAQQAFFDREYAGVEAGFGESGTFAVAFGGDGAAYITSAFLGSGASLAVRRYEPNTGNVSTVAQVTEFTMVKASGDGNVIGYAEHDNSGGPFGRYRISDQNVQQGSTQWENYEIGINHDGTQYALPTYGGTFIYDASFNLIKTLGVYAGAQPIGVAYHPTQNLAYFTWATTSEVRAYDTTTFTQVASYDFGQIFKSPSNNASFQSGRLKLSPDGSLLFALVDGGVRYLRVAAATPTPTPVPVATPIPGATPTPVPTPQATPTPGPPHITITTPVNGASLSSIAVATGTASVTTGRSLSHVSLELIRSKDNYYWTGSAWSALPTTLATILRGNAWSLSQDDDNGLPSGVDINAGAYTLVAIAYDSANESATASVKVTLGIGDIKPPEAHFTMPLDSQFINTFEPISGTASDNAGGSGLSRVTLILQRLSDGRYWTGTIWSANQTELTTQLTITTGAGSWTRRSDLPGGSQLLAGDYQIVANAYDAAGNKGSRIIVVTVDKTPPQGTFVTPANGALVNALGLIRGTATDNSGGGGLGHVDLTIRRTRDGYYWNGTTWGKPVTALATSLAGNSWQYKPTFSTATLQDGTYALQITAYDRAGNRSSATNAIRVDTVIPTTLTFTMPRNGAIVKALPLLQGIAADNAGGSGIQSVTLFLLRRSDNKFWTGIAWSARVAALTTTLTGTGTVTWSRSIDLPKGANLLDGDYALTALASDKAGNVKRTDSAFSVHNGTATAPATIPAKSKVTLSTIAARVNASSIQLVFTGDLDAGSASDPAHYSVAVGDYALPVESAGYNARQHSVVLSVPDGALSAGAALIVQWNALHDSDGQALSGQAPARVAY